VGKLELEEENGQEAYREHTNSKTVSVERARAMEE
jgi:hypothetical protein